MSYLKPMACSWCHSFSGGVSDGEETSGEDGADHDEADLEAAGEAGAEEGVESRVCIVTGDYAMQNVALQMGLRLVAPDGKRIWQTRRWALRCSACFQICKVRCRVSLQHKHQQHPMSRLFGLLSHPRGGLGRTSVSPRCCCHDTSSLVDGFPTSLLVTAGHQVCRQRMHLDFGRPSSSVMGMQEAHAAGGRAL